MEKNPYILILSENKLFFKFTVTKLKIYFLWPYLKFFYGLNKYFFPRLFSIFQKRTKINVQKSKSEKSLGKNLQYFTIFFKRT